MFITILNASKGKPFMLETPIENNDKLKIGIKTMTMWVGWYNIYEEQTCRWGAIEEGESAEIKIEPGYYLFKELVEILTDAIENLSIEVNPINDIINMSIPPGIQLLLPVPISYLLGMDDEGWLNGEYTGDRTIEFAPKRMLIYLKQLSTTNNFSNDNANLRPSLLLMTLPLPYESIGGYHTFNFDKAHFKLLQSSGINELDFDFKLEWGNGVKHKLDNHSQPIDIILEIK